MRRSYSTYLRFCSLSESHNDVHMTTISSALKGSSWPRAGCPSADLSLDDPVRPACMVCVLRSALSDCDRKIGAGNGRSGTPATLLGSRRKGGSCTTKDEETKVKLFLVGRLM